jgi:hypothetical protein
MHNLDTLSDAEIRSILQRENALGIQEEYRIFDKSETEGGWLLVGQLKVPGRIFDIAATETSCALCGKQQCGPTTLLLTTLRAGGTHALLQGICSECRPSTAGQSSLKIYYRSHLVIKSDKRIRMLQIENGRATPIEG